MEARLRSCLFIFWGYFFTTSKLLKSRGRIFRRAISSAVFLRLPQGSPIVHSFCTRAEGFSVAGRNILSESGFSEYVAKLKACRRMIAAKPAAAGNSRGVNCRGKLETRASANRLPGHCGLLYSLLFEQAGPLATAGIAESGSQNHILRIMSCSQCW
jgi:hypothetical protein